MDCRRYTLAEIPGFGSVLDCECGNIHLTVGPVSLTLEQRAYMQLVALVNDSAANYEISVSRRSFDSDEANETPVDPEGDSESI